MARAVVEWVHILDTAADAGRAKRDHSHVGVLKTDGKLEMEGW